MADISKLSRLIDGVNRNVDLSANTLVVTSIKVGAGQTELTQTILDKLITMQGVARADGKYDANDIVVAGSPTNYTAGTAEVEAHLAGIDTALATAGGTEFGDDVFRVTGSADATKKVAVEVDGLTTSTTRTITMPDTDVDLSDIATNSAKVSADGSVATHNDVTDAGSGIIISGAERTKLDGIEALADVTDATNVDAAGAVMESDSTTASMSFVIDEDDMISDSNTKIPTQQSVKAYVDNTVSSAVSYKGGYDAATDSPSLDSAPNVGIAIGDQYTVTVAGTFYTIDVEVGDVLIAEVVDPTVEAEWTIVNKNLDASSIKTSYESNSDTNAFTDAEKTKLGGIEALATADQTGAEIKVAYEAEADTNAFDDAAVAKLAGISAGAEVNRTLDAVPTNGNTTNSVSSDGVFDALALKQAASANLDEADTFFGLTDLSGAEAETLSDGSNADSLHSHAKIAKTMVAGEAFAANTSFMVRIALTGETAGRVYKADKDASVTDKFYAIGFIEGNGAAAKTAGENVSIVMMGEITLGSSDTVFSATEVGQATHVLAAGAFDAVSQITYATDEASYRGGMVLDTNKILVGNMQLLGIN